MFQKRNHNKIRY